MTGTDPSDALLSSITSMVFQERGYRLSGTDGAVFLGERPVGCILCGRDEAIIHAHGYFERWLWTIKAMSLTRLRVSLRRWQCQHCGRTTHSRPPDILPHAWVCTALMVIVLWYVILDGRDRGLSRFNSAQGGFVSTRTIARWFRRAVRHADHTEHFIRLAVIERCEPRPLESLFPSGLSPPDEVARRPWSSSSGVTRLWRALALSIRATQALSTPLTSLLAWARREALELNRPLLI